VIPWVLDAVALLGSDQPAVGILKSLKKSLKMASDATTLSHAARLSFSSSRDDRINFKIGDSQDMSGDALKELADQLANLRLEMAKKDERIDALLKDRTELLGVKSKFTALDEQVKKDNVTRHRKSLTDMLEAAVKSEDIQPRVRETFERVYGVNDDDQVMKVTADDVQAYMKANPNPYKKKVLDKVVSLSRSDGELPANVTADLEMVLRTEAALREDGDEVVDDRTFDRKVKGLFKANPSLAEKYVQSVLVMTGNPAARQ
jgi:hypothetical protein